MSTAFTDTERAILRIVQFQLPDTLTPYADIAREVGTDEETVLNLLRRMKEDGSIRRFGASIKHQKTGWTHNAMVAWIVDEADSDAIGEVAAKNQRISHVYFRPTSAPDWPIRCIRWSTGAARTNAFRSLRNCGARRRLTSMPCLTALKN